LNRAQVAFSAGVLYRFELRKEYSIVLDTMRKSADSPVLKGLFVAIVVVFIFWGVGSMRTSSVDIAARVNDEIITRRDFDRTYQNVANAYREMAPQGLPEDFIQSQAISQLVTTELLIQEADRLGLSVGDDELRDSIKAMPQFQVEGRFDKDNYVEVLRLNNLKPGDFEALQQRQLLAGKVQELVRRGAHISQEELRERFRYENERVDLRFVRVPAANFTGQVTLTDEDVQKYFAEHQEKYREPERVRLELIEFRPQDFAARVTPADTEVQAYYDAHLDDYAKPEEVRARHILFKLGPDATDAQKAEARKKAEDVLAKVKAGGDFAELAKQHSEDSTAAAGGDLGLFGRGVMTPAFETAAFALEPGQTSEIVETPFGLHLIRLEEKLPERQEPLDAVKASIIDMLKTQQARQLALKQVEQAHEKLLDGAPLPQVAADASLEVQTPPPFGAQEPIGTLGPRPELAKEAFNTEVEDVGEIVSDGTGYTVFRVVERLPSVIPPLDRVRPKVEADLRAERATALAKTHAQTLLEKLKARPDLAALAQEEGLKLEESTQIGRQGTYLPNLGNAPDLKDAAFVLTAEAPVAPAVYDVNGDAVLAVLAQRVPADDARFDSEKTALSERLQQQAEATALRNFLDQLRKQARIEYGQGFPAAQASS
jgi:peptidyl-prolyl cis-trans isomerase D